MRSLKRGGGLTPRRGMNDGVQRNIWLLSTPVCAALNGTTETLSNMKYERKQ